MRKMTLGWMQHGHRVLSEVAISLIIRCPMEIVDRVDPLQVHRCRRDTEALHWRKTFAHQDALLVVQHAHHNAKDGTRGGISNE